MIAAAVDLALAVAWFGRCALRASLLMEALEDGYSGIASVDARDLASFARYEPAWLHPGHRRTRKA